MTKRLVDIDDALLERARAVSGEPTIKATVAHALQRLIDEDLVLAHVARLRDPNALDASAIDSARRPRPVIDAQ